MWQPSIELCLLFSTWTTLHTYENCHVTPNCSHVPCKESSMFVESNICDVVDVTVWVFAYRTSLHRHITCHSHCIHIHIYSAEHSLRTLDSCGTHRHRNISKCGRPLNAISSWGWSAVNRPKILNLSNTLSRCYTCERDTGRFVGVIAAMTIVTVVVSMICVLYIDNQHHHLLQCAHCVQLWRRHSVDRWCNQQY